ncbi:hypothetical protein [Actinacidiphila sp. ITFR-21]|uniref:hypothetical protein n=1 Tax=Actinacidiphila sp. ITFR-21 TaxID=3075199 RepID=UPI00288C1129|nr:hypothetical protein [Streptomyces sp. ITFR-21]WNI19648.1 hypothetical protein RLT57_11270 [Streptomyces sp. ITFR-21]
MERALYGPAGFFVTQRPAEHFRTSVHASGLFAGAVAELLRRVDAALGHPRDLAFVDMAAGRAELSAALLPLVPARVRLHAVERAPRPPGLDPRVVWTAAPPRGVRGLLFANEWLDNVPVAVAAADESGAARYVEVRVADGAERLGAPVGGADAAWLREWWPLGPGREGGRGPGSGRGGFDGDGGLGSGGRGASGSDGNGGHGSGGHGASGSDASVRAEVGRSRDRAWADAAGSLAAGLAVAVDYGHTRAARPPYGTLTGYQGGRQVPPVPDGTRDLTAHVAVDSLGGTLTTQREALHALGVTAGRPPLSLAGSDPAGYVRALATASQAAELTARGGLGDFVWVTQPVGTACTGLLDAGGAVGG